MLNGFRRLFLSAALACALPSSAFAAIGQASARPEEQRINHDALMDLVAEPASRLDAGDLAGAEAAFERLLARQSARHGASSVEVADHLTAFALALFGRFGDDDATRAMRSRSLPYFRRAVAAARAAFGPDHPELALAIGTYADAAIAIAPDDPPRDLDAALEDAHRIYSAAYGPRDDATMATLVKQARLMGLRSRTGGDGERDAAAEQRLRAALRTIEAAPRPDDIAPFRILFALAEIHVRNQRPTEAAAVVHEIVERARTSSFDNLACGRVAALADRYRSLLLDPTGNEQSIEIRPLFAPRDETCLGSLAGGSR